MVKKTLPVFKDKHAYGKVKNKLCSLCSLLFCSGRLGKNDALLAGVVFLSVFLLSSILGGYLYRNGQYGFWYQSSLAPMAIAKFHTGKIQSPKITQGSVLDRFINQGSNGKSQFGSIPHLPNSMPAGYTQDKNLFFYYPGLVKMLSGWWHIIGYPSWNEVFLLLGLFNAATAVVAYLLLRMAGGMLPSALCAFGWGVHPLNFFMLFYIFRDFSRAIFIFAALALFLYFLRSEFSWKKVTTGGFLTGLCIGWGLGVRSDFIVIVPFVLAAVFFFHGCPPWRNWQKKMVFVAAVLLTAGAVLLPDRGLTEGLEHHAMEHVAYIGQSQNFLDTLKSPATSYDWCMHYSDYYAFMVGQSIARHRYKSDAAPYSAKYGDALRKELCNLAFLYPYDFVRLGIASSLHVLQVGFLPESKTFFNSYPGIKTIHRCVGLLFGSPRWLGWAVAGLALVVVGMFSFPRFLLLLFCFGMCSGIYELQYHVRHSSYLFIIFSLGLVFLIGIICRLILIWARHGKCFLAFGVRRWKKMLLRLSAMVLFTIVVISFLLLCRFWQNRQMYKTTADLAAQNQTLPWKLEPAQNGDEKMLELSSSAMSRAEQAKRHAGQQQFCDYMIVEFDFSSILLPRDFNFRVQYVTPRQYSARPPESPGYINVTGDFSRDFKFRILNAGRYYLFLPVYYDSRLGAFDRLRLPVEFKDSIKNVYRHAAPEKIKSNSVLFVPWTPGKIYDLSRTIEWSSLLGTAAPSPLLPRF